jgi:thioesterase domain-containing protein
MGRPFVLAPEDIKGMPFDEQLRHAVEAMHAQGAAPRDYDAGALRDSYNEICARRPCLDGYTPGSFPGTITLFRAIDRRGMDKDLQPYTASWTEEERQTLCWSRRVANRVEVRSVPGTHITMGAEPNVRVLASHLRETLAAARERAANLPDGQTR